MTDCVNMETRTCVFGYGGIRVGVRLQMLDFAGIRPPVGAGTQIFGKDGSKIGDWEYTGSHLGIMFHNMIEIKAVCARLDEIEKNRGGSFTFNGITFDFTKYEQASMDVVKSAMEDVKLNVLRLID